MKIDNIKLEIISMIKGRFELQADGNFKNKLLDLADKNIEYREILRIKRMGTEVDRWKTIVIVEIENEKKIRDELRKIINWVALIRESLPGTENTDLYLFLAFTNTVSVEECLRIESTEQFCRKYVLLPNEEISQFLNRTFLQKLEGSEESIVGEDPLAKAFRETAEQHSWLTQEIQGEWKKAFANLSGSDLADIILKNGGLE